MIFLDTGFLFALVSKRDPLIRASSKSSETFKNLRHVEHLLTTNHVIAETITLTRKIGHETLRGSVNQRFGEKLARIHWASPNEERAAFDISATSGSNLQRRRLSEERRAAKLIGTIRERPLAAERHDVDMASRLSPGP